MYRAGRRADCWAGFRQLPLPHGSFNLRIPSSFAVQPKNCQQEASEGPAKPIGILRRDPMPMQTFRDMAQPGPAGHATSRMPAIVPSGVGHCSVCLPVHDRNTKLITARPRPRWLGRLEGEEKRRSEAADCRCRYIDPMSSGRPSRERLPGLFVWVEAYPRAKPFLTPCASRVQPLPRTTIESGTQSTLMLMPQFPQFPTYAVDKGKSAGSAPAL